MCSSFYFHKIILYLRKVNMSCLNTDMEIKDSWIKRVVKQGVRILTRSAMRLHLLPRAVIIRPDGGICSQMHFYLVGEMLRHKGIRVLYDYSWFRLVGKDCDGRFERNLDIFTLFPNLKQRKAPRLLCKAFEWTYPKFYDYFDSEADPLAWLRLEGPAWLYCYFHDPEEIYSRFFHSTFSPWPADDKTDVSANCAVHIRRGDLSKAMEAYGAPPEAEYFRKAMLRIQEVAQKDVTFLLFSDEPEWVRVNLLPHLRGFRTVICDQHGSDKGYLDLKRMASESLYIIGSQGSMAKYAAMMRPEECTGGLVILPDTPQSHEWKSRLKNIEFI